MIEVKNASLSFFEKKILNNINFSIKSGESIAIVGKSGSGKTVLLKSLLRLLDLDHGEIWIDNEFINNMSFKQLQRLRFKIGMVFQFGALFDSMTVRQNISLPLEKLTELNMIEIKERIDSALLSVGLENTHNMMPAELSGGMKKRVGIARAIAMKPNYLFYDEPTTGLDPIMTDNVNKLIKKFQDSEKITSLVVTHDMRTVYEVVDRVLMIHDGSVYYDGTPKEIKCQSDPIIQQFISGDSTLV
tara:strand:- start:125 stop:859 length:735 start_codon:yes stop_codon:yes gene_type:complete